MTSPTYELQGAIVQRLKNDPALSAMIGGRVYDDIPRSNGQVSATFPFVSFGPVDETSDDATCITGFEISIQLDVWSRAQGFPECRQIIDLVRRALLNEELELTVNSLVDFTHRMTQTLRDPDGITSHGVLHFVALVEQA